MRPSHLAVGLVPISVVAFSAHAQSRGVDPIISWHTIDGGGSSISGGMFTLSGSIGQPDTTATNGGGFLIEAGFWGFPFAITTGCNTADLAESYGVLDFDDVLAFLVGYGEMDPVSDLAPPFGTFDLDDALAFLTAFGSGCP